MIRIQSEAFDPASELALLVARAPASGAVVSFVGLVRASEGDVAALELQHHPVLTAASVEAIASAGRDRFELDGLTVIHRFGRLSPGEPIVFVAAAAAHRRVAFDAVDYLMDRLKTEAVFWKREHGPGGSRWVEARDKDYDDHSRWGNA